MANIQKEVGSSPISPDKGLILDQFPPEMDTARTSFFAYTARLEKHRALLCTSQDIKAGKISPQNADQRLQARLTSESIDEIIEKSAANVRSLTTLTLRHELPYRKMEAEWLMQHPQKTYPAKDIVVMVRKLKNKEPVQLGDPLYLYLTRGGKSLEEHENEANHKLGLQLQRKRMINVARAIQDGKSVVGRDPLAVEKVRRRLQNETADEIINKLTSNIVAEYASEALGTSYRQIVLRIHEIETQLMKTDIGDQTVTSENSRGLLHQIGAAEPLQQLTRDEIFTTLAEDAKQRNEWVIRSDLPAVTPGFIRVYRGIVPVAIKTEFDIPPSEKEIEHIQAAISKSIDYGYDTLTDGEKELFKKFRLLQANRPRFFADSFESSKGYAHDGAVLVLDIPAKDAGKYYKGNGMMEFALQIPYEVSRHAQYYAVGPKALENK